MRDEAPMNKAKTCFLVYPMRANVRAVRNALEGLGIQILDTENFPAQSPLFTNIAESIQRADFVCAALPARTNLLNVMYEIGIAKGLGKRVLCFAEPNTEVICRVVDLFIDERLTFSMSASADEITAASLKGSGYEQALAVAKERDVQDYHIALYAEAKQTENGGNATMARLLRFLGDLCSMHFTLDKPQDPFGPLATWNNGTRTMLPKDLSDAQVTSLREFYKTLSDPELVARVADILWVRSRDHQAAQAAVKAYLESATTLEDPESWVACYERIERALQIARQLNHAALADEVVAHAEAVLDRCNGADPKYLSERLMLLLIKHRRGDPDKYTPLAQKLAEKAKADGDWRRAREHWYAAAAWRKRAKDQEGERRFLELAAEGFLEEANAVPSRLVATAHLQSAVEAFRRIGNRKRAEEVHKMLIEAGAESMKEMKAVSTDVSLKEPAQQARKAVQGRSLIDALLSLAAFVPIATVKDLREIVEDNAKNHPIQFIFHKTVVNEEGKKVGAVPSMLTDDPDDKEAAVRGEMFRQGAMHQQFSAVGWVEPARDQILLEHSPRIDDILALVRNTPFVPQDREQLFATGLFEGLVGNFQSAVHMLVPQIENSIRHVLRTQGVIVSSINAEGIQEEFDQGRLLELPEFADIFGPDLTFDLKGLLVSRQGVNLRNRLAHGLLDDSFFRTAHAIYLWWLALHLCCLPILARMKEEPKAESAAEAGQATAPPDNKVGH